MGESENDMSDVPESLTGGGEEPRRSRAHIEASRRVAQIMRAAEDAATQLLLEAERRADARIAEATRAADLRVEAAEAEAAEIVAEARRRASAQHESVKAEVAKMHDEASAEAERVVSEANARASEVQRIAEVFATQTRDQADQDARRHVTRARDLASEVLADGSEMSHNMRQLSESLRRNAETILLDVQKAHRAMTARLQESGLLDDGPAGASGSGETDFADVPEFIPRTPRRGR